MINMERFEFALYKRPLHILITVILLLLSTLPVFPQNGGQQNNKIQFDLQGDTHFCRYNFNDIKIPYNGFDSWTEIKLAYWLNERKTLSPYLSIIPTLTSVSEFWWQKNTQTAAGLQFYPVNSDSSLFRSIRLFAILAWRKYLDKPGDIEQEDTDIQIGIDYYYDTLFKNNILTSIIWSNAGFRNTNFSMNNYNAFLFTGNIKFGYKPRLKNSIFFLYAVSEWTYVPKYRERWWENFLRMGGGIRFYPKVNTDNNFFGGLIKRFHLYAEFMHNISWLCDKPDAAVDIKDTDFRTGFGFSTGGFFREK